MERIGLLTGSQGRLEGGGEEGVVARDWAGAERKGRWVPAAQARPGLGCDGSRIG